MLINWANRSEFQLNSALSESCQPLFNLRMVIHYFHTFTYSFLKTDCVFCKQKKIVSKNMKFFRILFLRFRVSKTRNEKRENYRPVTVTTEPWPSVSHRYWPLRTVSHRYQALHALPNVTCGIYEFSKI